MLFHYYYANVHVVCTLAIDLHDRLSYCSGANGVFPFCNEAGRLGCTVDRLSVAQCNLVTPTPSVIDPQFQV